MKRIVFALIALTVTVNSAVAFNDFGHKVISALAEKYMSDSAKKSVHSILPNGIVEESTWLNGLRKEQAFAHTKYWHLFHLDTNGKSTTQVESDGIVQLENAIAVLRDRANQSDSLVQASLRVVIHLVGDMHCLSHIRIDGVDATHGFEYMLLNELKQKSQKESWNDLWENTYLNRYTIFSPHYYGEDIDIYARDRRAEYEKGSPRFWVENVGEDVVRALSYFNTGEPVTQKVMLLHEYNHTKCMAKAAYRLAALLNDIFK